MVGIVRWNVGGGLSSKPDRYRTIATYPPGLFSPGTFSFCSAHVFTPSRLERTTMKSETLINRASTSYERLIKAPLLEDVLSRSKEFRRADPGKGGHKGTSDSVVVSMFHKSLFTAQPKTRGIGYCIIQFLPSREMFWWLGIYEL